MKLPFFLLAALTIPALAQAPSTRNEVKITEEGGVRRIRSNGIPDHATGRFPNRHNPNTIRAQSYDFQVPLKPVKNAQPTPFHMQPFGVAVNGVVFDPFAAEWWHGDPNSGWQYEPQGGAIDLGLDDSNAHVQPNGAYHYHGIPHGLVKKLAGTQKQMTLLGWAADGFPIYGPWGYSDPNDATSAIKELKPGYRVKNETRPAGSPGGKADGSFVQDYEWAAGVGDLDASNGREGVTPEFPQGTYYYVLTEAYPFVPRQFVGTGDRSFERRGPPGGPGGPGGGPPGRGPPPPGGRRGGPGMRPPPPPPF